MVEVLKSSANRLRNELNVIVAENNWNNLSKFLNEGKTFLEEICEEIIETCINYNNFNYNRAATIISENKQIFSKIFKFWHQKINSIPQTHRRTKRGGDYGLILDEFHQIVFLLYLSIYLALLVLIYFIIRPTF